MRNEAGATLIEFLIGITVGLMVATGALSMLVVSVQGQVDNIRLARLNQDLRAMMDVMVRDIRRAGFVTDKPAAYLDEIVNNPFFDSSTSGATTDLIVHDYESRENNCILYSYNLNVDEENDEGKSPAVDTSSPNERFGFRLTDDGELEMRRSGATNEICSGGRWETFTEPEVEITAVTFVLSERRLNLTNMSEDSDGDGCLDGDDNCDGSCNAGEGCNTCTTDGIAPDPACLVIRSVNISLAGQLRNDANIAQTLSQQVRVRNDLFLPALP